ncbi:Piso0_002741 [Millerozyma farinosa CBS 7064]|uniref:Piso0_002741 protein n=1 Tax=Pichia sorbitophila (strain ATCC MYA-4447 / BCRC 22081 / CBS 7064 / NBRC 10061 / NRRL Y-12695) TaxID=559304 RepID=G8YDD9_PICSO|nr:Piso0_002741 [Millerozyma farinosa CBS 7064]
MNEASEIDTGVSNGDVDWLFRGKSKKLTKNMNSRERKASAGEGDKERPSSGSEHRKASTGHSEKGKSDEASSVKTEGPDSTERQPPKLPAEKARVPRSSEPPVPETSSPATNSGQPSPRAASNSEKGSVFDKLRLGRSRSSSTGSATLESQPTSSSRRFSSSMANPPVSPATSASSGSQKNPDASSNESSPNVSRSNSTSKTRSLFTSLSAKFKSPGNNPAPTSNSPSNASPKLNPNLIGSASKPHQQNQSLATLIDCPLSDLSYTAMPKSRRSSASDASAGISVLGNEKKDITKQKLKSGSKGKECSTSTKKKTEMKRVNFALDKMAFDPQQQIPSRRPRKGNVLTIEDILEPTPRVSQGINHVDTGVKMKYDSKHTEKELKQAIEAKYRAQTEAEKHAYEAHLSAKSIAQEVSKFKKKSDVKQKDTIEESEDTNSAKSNDLANSIQIDKPIHVHETHFEDPSKSEDIEDSIPHNQIDEESAINNLSLEEIYTRCCHLREILPIPATLKQLKNKNRSLQVLKLLNPKPTLIDVLSFSDFIAITPINTIIFDNSNITTEMIKHLLSSLINNKSLEKLSLRNVPIDEEGWNYLCKFLSMNKTVKKLDISQQRIKVESKKVVRSAMNWELFIQALVKRGGVEELVINGCKLPDSVFKDLMEKTVTKSTYRLGIASTELNSNKAKVVSDWIASENSRCYGIDLAFNDLSEGQLKYFIEAFKKGNSNLIFFSLNSTKLRDVDEVSELIRALINANQLRFLDLSSLPKLFPHIISRLSRYLPQYPSLKRIHFDLNELSSKSIGAIADFLPKMKELIHVSILGNTDIDHGSAASLYTAVKLSQTIFTLDMDYSLISEELAQRIAFYLMRNMDRNMNSNRVQGQSTSESKDNTEEELMFDGSLLMEAAEKILVENDKKTDSKTDLKIQKIITNALVERTRAVRKDLHENIDNLFQRRSAGTLSLEGKETLLRLCLLDSSLEKLVHMIEESTKVHSSESTPVSLSSSLRKDEESEETRNTANTSHVPVITAPSIEDKERGKIASIQSVKLHESSNELLSAGSIVSPRNTEDVNGLGLESSFQPHQVVIDASADGTKVPIDNLTGRPVLMRSVSHTSVHAKAQEEEEGELHRWGFFIQSRNNDEGSSSNGSSANNDKTNIPKLKGLPSGMELRDAIIAAKGIESITDLIDKINDKRLSIDNIYKLDNLPDGDAEKFLTRIKERQNEHSKKVGDCTNCSGKTPRSGNKTEERDSDSEESMKSAVSDQEGKQNCECDTEVSAVVDKVYDKLLNDAQRVRSTK